MTIRMNTCILLLDHNIAGPVFLSPFATFHDSHPLRMWLQVRQFLSVPEKRDPRFPQCSGLVSTCKPCTVCPEGTLSLTRVPWLKGDPSQGRRRFRILWLTGRDLSGRHSVRIWDSEAGLRRGGDRETENPPELASSPRLPSPAVGRARTDRGHCRQLRVQEASRPPLGSGANASPLASRSVSSAPTKRPRTPERVSRGTAAQSLRGNAGSPAPRRCARTCARLSCAFFPQPTPPRTLETSG